MKKLIALLLALVMIVGLVACGKQEAAAPAETKAPEETKAQAVATEPAGEEGPKTMYAITGPSEVFEIPWFNVGPHTWVKVMYETLIGMDAKGDATTNTGMAESYTFADDGMTASVTLREGLKWHDGEPVTPEDVVWSFETMVNLTDPVQALVLGGAKNIKSMTIEGNTINFEFDHVNVTQLQAFTQFHILPKHCFEGQDVTSLQSNEHFQHPIGSGPWKLESVVMGEYCNLVPFEDYWAGHADFNIYITPSHIDADPNFVTKVLDGKLDYAYTKTYADVQALEGVAGVTVTPVSVLYTRWINFNQFAQPGVENNLLADYRVRKAIACALDRELICQQVFGGAADPGDGTLTPTGTAWKVEGLEPYAYNPELSKQLLAEAGWDSNRVLTMGYYYTDQTTQDLVAIMQQMLAAVGIKIEGWLIEGDTATLLNSMPDDRSNVKSASNVKWDLCYAALAATSFHNYYDRFSSVYGVNNSAPTNPELDAMIDKLMTSPSVEDQKAAYAELEKWGAENLYIMPMYYQPIWLVTTDKISHNLDLNNLGNPQFDWDMGWHNWTLK